MKHTRIASLLLAALLLAGLCVPAFAADAPVIAEPAATQLVIDGRPPELLAYLIGGNHYYNVRDLAVMFSGSRKPFNVVWDAEAKTLDLLTATGYMLAGGELVGAAPTRRADAVPFAGRILIDGRGTDFTGYTVGEDLYLRLCDIASALDFRLTWQPGVLTVDTAESYLGSIDLIPASGAALDTIALAAKAESVVKLVCYDADGKENGGGSGFFIGTGGQILTCFHVIEDCFAVEAVLDDGRVCGVQYVLAYDAGRDLAIIRAGGVLASVPLALGDSSVLVRGLPLAAIGSPHGLLNTFSMGHVSGFRQELGLRDDTLTDFQFSTPISRGSSGGPLLDACGNVLGLTYATHSAGQNLNFGIPINDAQPLLANFRSLTLTAFRLEVLAAKKAEEDAAKEKEEQHPEEGPEGEPIAPPDGGDGSEGKATALSAALRYA